MTVFASEFGPATKSQFELVRCLEPWNNNMSIKQSDCIWMQAAFLACSLDAEVRPGAYASMPCHVCLLMLDQSSCLTAFGIVQLLVLPTSL